MSKSCDIYLFGKRIGLLEEVDQKIYFQYDNELAYNISPIKLVYDTTVQNFNIDYL